MFPNTPLLLLLLLPAQTIAQCGPGAYYNKGKKLCYQQYTASVNFPSAESICLQSNGHLVSVHNTIDNTFLSQKSNDTIYVWLGAQAFSQPLTNPKSWSWTDNTPFDYQNYQTGQPSSLGTAACLLLNTASGKWMTASCSNSYPFVCAFEPDNTPQATCAPQKANRCPSRYAWLEETNYCYKAVIETTNFTEANEACKYEGSDLASVHSKVENDFLVELTRTSLDIASPSSRHGIYIGFIYLNNAWKWTDGSENDYRNWATGEPNNMDSEFWTVLMPDVYKSDYNPTGTEWNNVANINERGYICKRPAN